MLWQRKQKKVLDLLDLTQTQFVTQVDIAIQSNADRMMVSKVLWTLEDIGFITRQEHQTDTRAKVIRFTASGETVLQKAIIKVENADLDFFSTLETGLATFNSNMLYLINENNTEQ